MSSASPQFVADAEAAERRSRRHAAIAGSVSITAVILSAFISTNPILIGVSSVWGVGSALIWHRRRRKTKDARLRHRQKTVLARRDVKERVSPVDDALHIIRRQANRKHAANSADHDRLEQTKDRQLAEAVNTRFRAERNLPTILCPVTLHEEERCLHASRGEIHYIANDGRQVEDKGYVLLTSERLIFTGDRHTVHTLLSDIANASKSGSQAFLVATGDRKRTAAYRVSYPCEFLAYISCVCKMEILSPTIIY